MSATAPRFSLAPEWRERVRVGTLFVAPVAVAATGGELAAEIAEHNAALAERYRGVPPAQIEALVAARSLYRAFGIDPTKTRPSSEKLLRRVLQGKPFPAISNAVDLGNSIALRLMLPIGLYDAAKIEGDVVLRAGEPDEAYEGIAGQRVGLGGRPALVDARGAFGNPTADSARTAVGESAEALWMTVFAPADTSRERMDASMQLSRDAFLRHLAPSGETAHSEIALFGFDQ